MLVLLETNHKNCCQFTYEDFAHCYQEAGLILIGLEEKVRYILRSKENDYSYPVYNHHHSCHHMILAAAVDYAL